jgi:predicted ester cyclase
VSHAAVPEAQGRAGFVATMTKIRTAFPDMTYKLEDVLVDGDRAVLRVTAAGTNSGPLGFVRLKLEPTNKPVKFEQIHILRIGDGKIVEHWLGQDSVAMFRQLGLQISPQA